LIVALTTCLPLQIVNIYLLYSYNTLKKFEKLGFGAFEKIGHLDHLKNWAFEKN
jgi:hypothetical protein